MSTDIKIHQEYIAELVAKQSNEVMTEAEAWHFNRRMGIGGSDIGAILGLNPYKTPMQVWEEKRGIAKLDEEREAAYWGKQLEALVAQEYAKRNNVKVQRLNHTRQHADFPWMCANIDRIVWEHGKKPVVKDEIRSKHLLECKTASVFAKDWGEENSDEIPYSYWLQSVWYLATLDATICDVALLRGGQEYHQYQVMREMAVENMMIDRARQFWFDHVIANVPPEPVQLNEVNEFFRQDNGQSTLADHETVSALQELKRIKQEIKDLKAIAEKHEAKVKKSLGMSSILIDHYGQKLASWKIQQQKRFDISSFKNAHPELAKQFIKPSESRVFRV
ncbi:YqaJ viral recombinase family protein [Zooshikella ganghwensis]|uniref:YqaJ viral recombinase family nuclease n=1 Tax=Zooshikella ganghwensis TaxID=202772 RepID=UPI00041A4DDB|nr:YqaJ viral recombinase family protein [Zooshikella ganghwensis]